jgi:isoquinoline 1-oxidoreductase beta subunit
MYRLTVNGQTHELSADGTTPLLWVLRNQLGLKGTKYGCGVGVCGICKVLVNGELQHACALPLLAAAGAQVTTVEGLVRDHPVVRAWVAEQVPQCGYCQGGQIMAAVALHGEGAGTDSARAAELMGSVLCRCGTYQRVRAALRRASSDDPGPPLPPPAVTPDEVRGIALDQWICVAPDDGVTLVINHAEMGQGVVTALAMLVAEELDVGLEQVRTEFAPAQTRYANPVFGVQLTGGSTSVRGMWEPLRQAGASARQRLVRAAAQRWGVPPEECVTAGGRVRHPGSGQAAGYGELVQAAQEIEPGGPVTLKTPAHFRLLGRSQPRLDIPALVTGQTCYGIDVSLPGMLSATIVRPPVWGGRPRQVDASAASSMAGVRSVLTTEPGVAVVAEDVWPALKARRALRIHWDLGVNAGLSDAQVRAGLERGLARQGEVHRRDGDAPGTVSRGHRRMEAVYTTSHLAHGTLEPMNCLARVSAGRCEVWLGTQSPHDARAAAAKASGLRADQVVVHNHHLGGGFGRRGDTEMVAEAVTLAVEMDAPVQVLWTREDDLQHDRFRPAHMARLEAALGEDGRPLAWVQHSSGPALALDGVEIAYAIPHVLDARIEVESPVPTGAWRGVGPGQNAFVVEGFIDELAAAAGRDPYAYRRELLAHSPRHLGVLDTAARAAGWACTPPPGVARGIAVYRGFGTWVAQVAEVSVAAGGIRVHRVVCALDCGTVVNPDTVRAQVEGAVAMGVSAALKEAVVIADGRVSQSTFADYPILTYGEMPTVEVHIVPSGAAPGGVGEPGLLPVAPAVANAVFAATGTRLRTLPLRL